MAGLMIALYTKLNAWADDFEERVLPDWLSYNYIGDPISWVFSHPAFTAGTALLGALVGAVQGAGWRVGAVIGAVVACLFYTFVRELPGAVRGYRRWGWAGAWRRLERNPWPRPEAIQVGYLADAIGDVVGCYLLTALLWWVLL